MERLPSGRGNPRVYRQCRREILGACRAEGTQICAQPPVTTTTTLPEVPVVSLTGRWTLELEALEVFGCTKPSTFGSVTLDIAQSGTMLKATAIGFGNRLSGYEGEVTRAGFHLGVRYTRRIRGDDAAAT
jgi:hypothetical protein